MHPDMCGDKTDEVAPIFPAEPFVAFGKIPRLSRDIIITEKIDGTNAQILVPEDPAAPLLAGSRSRWLTPGKGTDNFGFAAWVKEHEAELRTLGPGRHYGEWFGAGIQRGYGLKEKRFALFNVGRWYDFEREGGTAGCPIDKISCPECCSVVPVLYNGNFSTGAINVVLANLGVEGSAIAPGFMKPEGIIIFHTASGQLFKKTLEGDEKPKRV